MTEKIYTKSRLVPLGIFLVIVSYFSSYVNKVGMSIDNAIVKSIIIISTDILRASFLIGIGCLIIGILRNRKLKAKYTSAQK